jgi:uncharacterized protein YbaP (TraB family)
MKFVVKILAFLLLQVSAIEIIAQKRKSGNHSLLYKVESKGSTPFYLFGTIHLICADQFKVSESLELVLEQAETLYLELDMNAVNPLAVFSKAVSSTALDEFLPAPTVDSLKKFIATQSSLNLPWMVVKKLQPVFIQQLFMQNLLDCKTEAIDLYLNKRFVDMKKPVKGLETFEFQLDMMMGIEYKDQVEGLLQYMRQPDQTKEQFGKLVETYLRGNAEELYALINEDKSFVDMEDKFLSERNENWVKIMKENKGKQKYLYAFGAGHLGGKKGVIALLKKEGFKVTPIEQK